MGAVLSIAGAPPTIGFWPEFLTFSAGFSYGNYTIAILAVFASVLSAVYCLRLVRYTFFGPVKDETRTGVSAGWTGSLALVLLFLALVFFGIYPVPAFSLVRDAVGLLGYGLGG